MNKISYNKFSYFPRISVGFLNIFIVNKVKISTKMYLIYGASNSFI